MRSYYGRPRTRPQIVDRDNLGLKGKKVGVRGEVSATQLIQYTGDVSVTQLIEQVLVCFAAHTVYR